MLTWTGDEGVVGRSFRVGDVAGVIWSPTAGGTPPAVLIGHGGSGHKRSPNNTARARRFVSRGLAAVAIDGPYHGERVPTPLTTEEYQAKTVADGLDAVLDRVAGDWVATVDALGSDGLIDPEALGYIGHSLGARYGLAATARLATRLRCVVLGKFGLATTSLMHPGLSAPDRVRADAARISAPTLFHMQWDDELFTRQGQLDLFDAIGAPEKQLAAFPGQHGETSPAAFDLWCDFITARLTAV